VVARIKYDAFVKEKNEGREHELMIKVAGEAEKSMELNNLNMMNTSTNYM